MKRILFLVVTMLIGLNSFSQAITVNNTTYTVPQLVQNVLFASPSGGSSACVGTISNITWITGSGSSDGTSFGSSNGIGYFQNTNPNFPLTSGVILSTGNALSARGPNTTIQSNGTWPGDIDLFNYIDGLGIDPGLIDFYNATVLEFDFTPLTTTMSFDFLFASEEYGDFQCSYSDSFAFFLTNETAGSAPVNLALVPSTTTPISVVTIRDGAYFTGFGTNCGSTNPSFFGNFNNLTPAVAAAAATNFNGETVKMTASSAVIPNNLYHIKLVIADRNDDDYDSAVFLGGGSFNIGTTDIAGTGSEFNGQTDFSGSAAICASKTITVQAGSVQVPGATYAWTLNGNPIGGNTYLYTITQQGNYGLTITYPGGCQITDSMIVEYIPSLTIGTPSDLTQCSAPFNLTSNNSTILNGLTNTISFHNTLLQAQELASPIPNPLNYNGTDGEIIYVAVQDNTTDCITTTQFTLNTDASLCTTLPIPGTPPNLVQYETTIGSGVSVFDFTPQTTIIYGANPPSNYTVTYYLNLANATAGTNPIAGINAFSNISNPQTIYAVLSQNSVPTNFAITSFQLIVVALPTVSISGSTTICSGSSATINFAGTPNATVNFNVNGNPRQIVLNASGNFVDTLPSLNTTTIYNLVSVSITTPAGTTTQPVAGSVTITVNSFPTPTASATVQPTCTTPTGTIVVTAPTGVNLEYSVNGATYQASATFTGLTPNNYNVTVRNTTNGCVSTATLVTINAVPTIATPTASTTVQPTCTIPTATIVVTAPTGANLEYSVNGTTYQASATFTGLTTNNYNVTVRNTTNGCVSTATVVTINAVPTVATPTASATVQPTCTTPTGIIVVTAPTGVNLEYSVNGATYQASATFTGLTPNNYNVTVRNTTNGCISTTTPLTVNPIPSVAVPTTTIQQPDCTILTGSIQVDSPLGASLQYSIDGIIFQASPNFTGLVPNNYTITVKDILNGCTNTTAPIAIVNSVNDVIVNTNPLPLQDCDPNNDGYVAFDLTQIINSITGGNPGYTVTFHETVVDATIGGTNIPNPLSYDNINPWTQTIFIRVDSNTTTCFEVVQLQLIVDPTPIATEPNDYELCDYSGALGFETYDLTTTIPEILGSLNPLTHAVTFYTSQAAAELGTGNITNTTSYTNGTINTQTIYIRVENIVTGCYDIVTLQLIVNPLPNSTQPNYPQYSLCDYNQTNIGFETFDLASQVASILLGQTGMDVTFYPSLVEAQNNTNAITNLQYTNAIIYVQTLGIRITNTTTGCYVISTMDIRVEPLPTPIPLTQPYTICDDNQDGFANFDLASLIPDLLQGANYVLTFHETLPNANSGANPIDTSVPYFSINPFVQILYVRAEDAITGCFSILPIELNTNPSPIAPVNLNPITVCDQDSNPQSASTLVNLTQQTAAVLAQQTGSATNYTVTYYTSQLLAEQGTAPIIPATSYFGANLQTIWVRVENNNTQCYNVGSFQLQINTPLLLTTPAPLSLCDDDANPNDQYHAFNLTIKDTQINQGTTATVTYYPSLSDAQNNTNAISPTNALAYVNIPPAVQTLGVVVTTTAGCKSITTLDIRVLPIPTPNTNPTPLAPKCDDNLPGDMLEVFDLTANAAYIINGDPNVTLHYFATQADAAANQNELIPATAALVGANVWIRVENNRVDYQGNNCYVLVEQPLTVNPLPIVLSSLAPYRACDDNTDGIAVFDLTNAQLAIAILGATQLPADYTISYYLTAAGANPLTNTGETPLPNNYTNVTPNAETIYIRVVNNTTGCVNTGILPLAVEPYATATGPQTFNQCDSYSDPYDGVELIDLTTYAPAILNGQDPTIFLVSYYTSFADAQAGTNALTLAEAQAYQTDADTDTIWVKVENSSNLITPFCNAITTINLTVERKPNPIINTANNVTTICVDFITDQVVRPLTLNSGVTNPSNYTFQWFEGASTTPIPGATGPSYTVDTPSPTGATRDYTVTVISNSLLTCQTTSLPFSVVQSGQAVIPVGTDGYTVTSAFSSLQTITVTIEGYGAPDYQYSLDDGPRQTSNVFENVSLGTHVIHVWDAKGDIAYSCEELIITDVQIIDYPYYFTPNGDGIHDTWNIIGLGGQPNAKIYIFDRYGKLLKQISSTGAGWDGIYNGYLLPSDDYWFTVDFIEGATVKQFKAHFSLKR